MSVNCCMTKQHETRPRMGCLLASDKKGWMNINICCSLDEPQKHYAKNKPSTKRSHIIRFYLYEMSRLGESLETVNRWGGGGGDEFRGCGRGERLDNDHLCGC